MLRLKSVLLAITAGTLLTACATSPTGRSQLTLFPDDQMAQMGSAAFAEMKKTQKTDTSRTNNAYVDCVANAIVAALRATPEVPTDMKRTAWEVEVFKDDSPNAFALPGGKIGVHTGMLKVATTQDQLAAVLGHEVGHVWARHGNERMSQQFAAQTGLQLASVLAGEPTAQKQQLLGLLGVGTQVGVLLPFSRKHESEADVIGLTLMARAGFDPRDSVRLWQNMAKAAQGKAPNEFFSTHPATSTRIRDLQANMNSAMAIYNQARARGENPSCKR